MSISIGSGVSAGIGWKPLKGKNLPTGLQNYMNVKVTLKILKISCESKNEGIIYLRPLLILRKRGMLVQKSLESDTYCVGGHQQCDFF